MFQLIKHWMHYRRGSIIRYLLVLCVRTFNTTSFSSSYHIGGVIGIQIISIGFKKAYAIWGVTIICPRYAVCLFGTFFCTFILTAHDWGGWTSLEPPPLIYAPVWIWQPLYKHIIHFMNYWDFSRNKHIRISTLNIPYLMPPDTQIQGDKRLHRSQQVSHHSLVRHFGNVYHILSSSKTLMIKIVSETEIFFFWRLM